MMVNEEDKEEGGVFARLADRRKMVVTSTMQRHGWAQLRAYLRYIHMYVYS